MPSLLRRSHGFLLFGAVLSCSSGSTNTPPAVASISLSQATASLAPGATLQLTASPLDAAGATVAGQTISWTTSAGTVATVSTSGLVTAVAAGTATITASAGGKSASATVTVAIPVASVTLSQSVATLVPTATVQLTATPKDGSGATVPGQTIAWTTSASAVATVSAAGLVTAVTIGTATVTATVSDKSASAVITVQAGAVIGAAGGTVTSVDGNASVTIPAGALGSNTSISIVPTTSAPSSPLPVGSGYDFSPSGTQFSAPVTIRLKYDPALVPAGHSADVLQIRTLAGSAWTPVSGAVVDSMAHTVTGTTTHFSTYIATDVSLTFGLRDGDTFTAVRASSASISICVGATRRVVVLFYSTGLMGMPIGLTWGPGAGYAWGGGELANPSVITAAITVFGAAPGGPNDMIVTVGGETATLHVTVVPCPEPMIAYTLEASGHDNVQLYSGGVNTALTTDNNSYAPAANPYAVGATGVYNSGTNRQLNYYNIGWTLRASLLAPFYTTTNFIESFNWVTATQLEFAESSPTTGLYSLFRMNTDGTGKSPFAATATAGGSARQPYLAGNGFTYFGFAVPPGTGATQLYRVDAAGANMTALFPVSGWASTPTVSQDGQWLAMSVLNLGFTAAPLLLYNLNDPQAAPIAVSPANGGAYFPAFCGSGVLYYTYSTSAFNGPWTVYRWDIVTRNSTPVAFLPAGSFPEGISIAPQKGMPPASCPK